MAKVPGWKDYQTLFEQLEKQHPSNTGIKNVSKTLQVLYSMSGLCQYNAAGELLQQLRPLDNAPRKPVIRMGGHRPAVIRAGGHRAGYSSPMHQLKKLIGELEYLQTSLEPFRTRKYDEVVCMGFEIGVPGYGWPNPGQYHGYDDDIADVDARWAVMEEAIFIAYQEYHAQLGNKIPVTDDKKALKIFMAPEFYFRGKRGAYDVGAMPYLCEKARSFTQQALLADWLFVLGSCVCSATEWQTTGGNISKGNITTDQTTGKYSVNKPTDWKQKESDEMVLLDNYAIVQKGGIPCGEFGKGERVVLKQMRSHIDFDYQTSGDKNSPVHLKKAGAVTMSTGGKYTVGGLQDGHYKLVDKATQKTDERGPYGSIFDMDGITFGLEVCLDHYDKRLMNSPNDKNAIRIQLIPSWGAEIVAGNHINQGIIFNVDGQNRLYGNDACAVNYYNPGSSMIPGRQNDKYAVWGPNADAAVFDGQDTIIRYWGPLPIPL